MPILGIRMVILRGQLGLGVLAAAPPSLACLPWFGAQSFPGSHSRPGLGQDS